MGHVPDGGPDHADGTAAVEIDPRIERGVWPAVLVCALVTFVAVLALWPGGDDAFDDPLLLDTDRVPAEVERDDVVECSYAPDESCRVIGFVMTAGPYADEYGTLEQGLDSRIRAGDDIYVTVVETEAGRLLFDFYDFQRDDSMLILLALFCGAVIALGRWRGLGALAGLAVSLLVIIVFTLPAILDGSNAVIVAVVSASVIAFLALFLAHGIEVPTAVALLSTLASLSLTALLAWAFVGFTHLTGLTDDSSLLLAGLRSGIDPRGIVLAGIVIGALGVLDDVTVTQVSAVWQLKAVQPDLTTAGLFRPAMRIGRDHISSTVNTLFLAYAGTSLPLLLLFTEAGQGFGSVITREIVAVEVVRTLVGSIGLVASVPISTGLAALAVRSEP